ncbi:MAG: DUF3823 domain-containing protein [Parabacteroides merdae]
MLLLSKTQFADDVNNLYRQDFSDVVPGSVNLSADISGNTEIVKAKALHARVGVLANGADSGYLFASGSVEVIRLLPDRMLEKRLSYPVLRIKLISCSFD